MPETSHIKRRKILIIAGEPSGDRLAARVMQEGNILAASLGTNIEWYGIGGEQSKAQGLQCLYTTNEVSVVGFLEVAKRYLFFKRVFSEMVALLDTVATRPDVILLVDYPGFNIRFAAEAKKRNIEVIYYVSPQVWAWKPSRVKKIVNSVSRMLVIFPFEQDIYIKAGLANTEFVGHPLIEITIEEQTMFSSREAFALKYQLDPSKEWLLVFAGSRNEEVRRHLAIMTEAATALSSAIMVEPIVVESANVSEEYYRLLPKTVARFRNAEDVHQLMFHSQLGILKSGTTTLEAALLGLPGVICYKTSFPTYWMARMLLKLNYIGLANIVLGKMLYPEILQNAMTTEHIIQEILTINNNRAAFREQLMSIRSMLQSENASPSKKVAYYLLTQ